MGKNKTLTLGSLFDGSGGFPLGGVLSGIQPIWASEIEPFPIRVTTKRMPFIKHYGDISKMKGSDIEPVDIITFGSPCQDMSLAGKRAGLDGSRSSLFYEAVRIVKEMRCRTNGQYPRYIVWENVTGAFSSNKGEDFRAVLEAVASIAEEVPQVPMPEKGKWPYADVLMAEDSVYDKAAADYAVGFIECLHHTKGTWAGKPFELIDWQEKIIRDLFGTLKPNGYRQFNTAYIEIAKKNGKSELAAAVALLLCCGDGEQRAEVYGCAADRGQATIVFDVAADMVRMCPALNKRVKILASQKRLIYLPTKSFYQVLSAEAYSKHECEQSFGTWLCRRNDETKL